MAARFGTEHHELIVEPTRADVLPKLAWHYDEPFADSSAIPTYYVSKITREHVTVALSGDGGDENFAGYGRYARAQELQERLDHGLLRLAQPLLRLAAGALPWARPGKRYAGLLGAGDSGVTTRAGDVRTVGTLRHLLTADLRGAVAAPSPRRFSRLASDLAAPDYVVRACSSSTSTPTCPSDILTKVDRASMAVSLEVAGAAARSRSDGVCRRRSRRR